MHSSPSYPPAIWTAFARQGSWKSWALVAQFFVIVLLVLVNLRLAQKEPDVVLVGPEGEGHYIERSAASAGLLQYLAEQKQVPSELTVATFSRSFLELSLAINSSTIEEAWPQALAMTAPGLREKLALQAANQRLVETYKLAQVRTRLEVKELQLVERTSSLFHVHATVERHKSALLDGAGALAGPAVDILEVDIVERVVPRSPRRPDGLEVAEWRVSTVAAGVPPTVEGGGGK